MPCDGRQIDIQPRWAAVSERPTSMTCELQLQRGYQVARIREIAVVTGADDGLDWLGRPAGRIPQSR